MLAITAPYDAPRRGLVLNDRWRAPLRRGCRRGCSPPAARRSRPLPAARVAGYEPGWLGAVQLVPTLVLLVAVAAAADIALSACSPGAGDNASGVAVALALFDELERDPPHSLRPAVLLTGAGHVVPRSAARHLRGRGAGRRAAHGARARAVRSGPAGMDGPPPAGAGRRPSVPRGRWASARARARTIRRHGGPGDPHRLPGRARDHTRAHIRRTTRPENVDAKAMAPGLDLALGVVDALDADLSARAPDATSRG